MYKLKSQFLAVSSLIYLFYQTCTATASTIINAPIGVQSNGPTISISREIGALSIEFCYILDYLGDLSSPNTFSRQLLQNIEDRLGAPPVIRIGGHTQDVARYCEHCTSTLANVFVPGNAEAVNVTFSKGLFEVLNNNVPSKQQFIFGLNLGQDDVQFPLAEVVAAEKYLRPERLRSFELGNEPDFFNIQRPHGWNVQIYAQQIVDWLSQIHYATKRIISVQLGAFAQEPIYMGNFSLVELRQMGVATKIGHVTSLSDHTYPFSICDSKRTALVSLPNLMNHINTIQYFSQWASEIAAAKSQSIPFVIGETGSVSCHGKEGVSNSLGAALWSLDYMLHGAVLGMQSVYFHAGTPFYYSMWQPVIYNNTPAIVWPTYYSLLFIADAIGDISNPRIEELSAFESERLSLYALYSGNTVQKIIALNLEFFDATTARPAAQDIDVSAVLGQRVSVRRFTGVDSTATGNVTWAGQNFDTGAGVGSLMVEKYNKGQVSLGASEAVLIEVVSKA